MSNQEVYEVMRVARQYAGQAHLQLPEVVLFMRLSHKIVDQSVLDIGCGGGRTTGFLACVAASYVGCDYASTMIDLCRQRYPGLEFQVADARRLSGLRDASFDFVFFPFNGIDSLDHDGRLRALREMRRVLKPGGVMAFSSHNRECEADIVRPRMTWSLNPVTTAKRLVFFLRCLKHHRQNVVKEVRGAEYAILNDEAHSYRLLNYYIDPLLQVRQLESLGCQVILQVGQDGMCVSPGSSMRSSRWVYYAARKED